MIKEAFQYALREVTPPSGKRLWLQGEPESTAADVYQPWQREALIQQQRGCHVFSDVESIDQKYAAVFVQGSKQHEETEGLMAVAFARSQGFVMAVAANDAGGGRIGKIMESFGVEVHHLSKSKCRIVWTTQAGQADKALVAEKLAELMKMRQVEIDGENWWSQPGLFGWNKIDPGSALLVHHLPDGLTGKIADFGCGYGYLSAMLARHYPDIETIDAYDADARAVACCQRNNGPKVSAIWQDVLTMQAAPRYDAIVMNPPFHNGKKIDLGLGEGFIRCAWENLKPNGRLFVVANRHLPYEHILPEFGVVLEEGAYKLMTGRKP